MKHKIQSYGSEDEPYCKIPRIGENNIFEDSLSVLILKHQHTKKRKHQTQNVADDDIIVDMEAKKRRIFKMEMYSEVQHKTNSDGVVNEEMDSDYTCGHSTDCKTEKLEFSCYNFWRSPLPAVDLCEFG
ncbi:uncharacterized protein LOC132555521 [Ylistrum balloti]|uniref:uncharacterized protein LOC132555521 n=1 Tax=Ylistrum balloti TaxID=509963 RepID=UPI00290597BC|nr:uncharacterized protein LOC132555521 [Ylistrum balloti]